MTCEEATGRFTALADGELSAETATALKLHIAGCSNCADVYRQTRAVAGIADAWVVEPRPIWAAIAGQLGLKVNSPVQESVYIPEQPLRDRIGSYLLEKGYFSAEQFQAALDVQKSVPAVDLGRLLIDLGFADERDVRWARVEVEGKTLAEPSEQRPGPATADDVVPAPAASRVATSAPGDAGEPGGNRDSAVIRMANAILVQAIGQGASDIHIEPDRRSVRVRYRVDGVLHETMTIPKHIQAPLIDRYKIMSDMNIAERSAQQEGTLGFLHGSREHRFRVLCTPSAEGERLTLHSAGQEEQTALLPEAADVSGLLEEMRRMRAEMQGLRAEVAGLRRQLASRSETPQRPSPPSRLFPHAAPADAPFRLL